MELKFLDEEYVSPPKRKKTSFALIILFILILFVGVYLIVHYVFSNVSTPVDANAHSNLNSSITSSEASSTTVTNGQVNASTAASVSSNLQTAFQQSSDWELVLVNNSNILPENFQPQITNYYGAKVDKRIVPAFDAMKKSAAKEGISLWISSGYRSLDQQKVLFNQEVQKSTAKGVSQSVAEETAAKTVAKPGYSEHNTGLALDLNGVSPAFESSKAFIWLQSHAADYGFILRFPKGKESITGITFEPWHYRYVGKENALKIKSSGQCLEQYLKSAQ